MAKWTCIKASLAHSTNHHHFHSSLSPLCMHLNSRHSLQLAARHRTCSCSRPAPRSGPRGFSDRDSSDEAAAAAPARPLQAAATHAVSRTADVNRNSSPRPGRGSGGAGAAANSIVMGEITQIGCTWSRERLNRVWAETKQGHTVRFQQIVTYTKKNIASQE